MNPTKPHRTIDELREIHHRISASCDHDPAKLVAYLMQYQEQFRDRLIYDPNEQTGARDEVPQDRDKATA